LMDSGAEIPEWAVSPRILLNVTGMGADHCARLLAHPAITPSGLEYIAERMTVAVASTLAGRRATPAGALDALARKRSDEQILIAIAGNPRRTSQTLEALVAGPNARVVQAAIVGLLEMHSPSQVASIIAVLSTESLGQAIVILPTSAALSLATDPSMHINVLSALSDGHPDLQVQRAIIANPGSTSAVLSSIVRRPAASSARPQVDLPSNHLPPTLAHLPPTLARFQPLVRSQPGTLAQMTDRNRASLRALAALDPRTDRDAAEAALADPSVAAAVMDTGVEIPGWAVSPSLLLDVTEMDVDQCARLLAHPAITTQGVDYIAERMNGTAARALAARCDSPAGILEVLARNRSDAPTLIAIAGNHQCTTQTLEALVAGTCAKVVQAAVVGLLQTLHPSQVALIITALPPESMALAIAGLPASAALTLAADPAVHPKVLSKLSEGHPHADVQRAIITNPVATLGLLAEIAGSQGQASVLARVALYPVWSLLGFLVASRRPAPLEVTAFASRLDRPEAEITLAGPRISAAIASSGSNPPSWVVSPKVLLDVTGMGADQCARLLAHPAIMPDGIKHITKRMSDAAASVLASRRDTPSTALAELARTRSDEKTLIAIARNSSSTTETLEVLMQHGIASVGRAAATASNAPPELLRSWILSLDVHGRVRLAGEPNLSSIIQRELSRDIAEQVRDCLLRNPQVDPAIAAMMRRRPHLELPQPP
jgi:hypothetical protein